jgi:hypothetical protein
VEALELKESTDPDESEEKEIKEYLEIFHNAMDLVEQFGQR